MGLGQPAVGAGASVIAVLLAKAAGPPEDRAALYARARLLVLPVCRHGPLDALRDIAASARRDALGTSTPEGVRHAALEFIAALDQRVVAETLVDGVARLGSLSSEAEALLAACGGPAIWAIAAFWKRERESPAARDLRDLARRFGQETWAQALVRAERRSFEDVASIFPLLGELPPHVVWPVGSRLLEHPDLRVRRQMTAFLLGTCRDESVWGELVRRSLVSADKESADMARAALLKREEPPAELVELALSGEVPAPSEGRLRDDLLELAERIGASAPGQGMQDLEELFGDLGDDDAEEAVEATEAGASAKIEDGLELEGLSDERRESSLEEVAHGVRDDVQGGGEEGRRS